MRLAVFIIAWLGTVASTTGQIERREEGNLIIEGIPEISSEIHDRLNQYQNIRSATLADWLPDGSGLLIRTRLGETTQFHKVVQPGGTRHQLTFFNEPVSGGTVSPKVGHNGFLFTKDIGGNEFSQIFWFDMKSGKSTILTDGESRNGNILWSNQGDRFAFTSTKRNKRDFDIYLADIEDPKQATIIVQKGGAWGPVDWSPDDSKMIVGNYISANVSYLHILDLQTGALKQINPAKEDISYDGAVWSADSKGLFLLSDQGGEFSTLKYYDLATQKFTSITGDIPWDVNSAAIDQERTQIAFTVNHSGLGKLYLMETATKKYRQIGDLPAGQVYGLEFHPNGEQLGLVINTMQTPGDVYVMDLKTELLTRWTYSEVGGLQTSGFPSAELVEFETFDKVNGKPRKIPAFVYKPKSTQGPLPVIISIHGGPEGQHRPFFNSLTSYLVNELGIAVIAPNVRGSAGYGKSYLKLDNGFKREETVKDIGMLIEWIAKNPEFDAQRIAVYGGSYGGYMVLGSMTNFNDKIRCGVDIVGISNFVTFLENTQEYRRDLRRVEYGDERDPKMRAYLNSISPTTNAHKITKPLLVIQGANDPRVPASESEQMVEVIRKNGGDVWYLLAKDEGHGFDRKSNRDYMTAAIVSFYEKYLLGVRPDDQKIKID